MKYKVITSSRNRPSYQEVEDQDTKQGGDTTRTPCSNSTSSLLSFLICSVLSL